MGKSVAIRAVSIVVPRNGTEFADPEHGAALSNLDHVFCSSEHYPQLIFFYRSHCASSSEISTLMQSLKDSLALVLEHYAPMAGRVRASKQQQGRLELVRQPGDGVVFVEATTDARLDDWPDLRRCSLILELIPQENMCRDIEEVPMAKVQVTVFKCGGVALGFSFAHVLTDGMGATQFLKAWGAIHQRQHLSITPLLSRTIIKARDPPQLTVPIPEATSSFMLPPSTPKASPGDDLTYWQLRVLNMRVSDEKVSECVEEVARGPFAYGTPTSHEALCALVWSSLTRARGWSSDQEESRFYFPLNIRSRCDPPIPEGYFGNAILQCYIVAKAVAVATRHISYAAKLIHETIQSHTADFCQSAIDWTELQLQNGKGVRLSYNYPEAFGCTTFVGFPIYEVSFGWGKPLFVSFVQMPSPESYPNTRSGLLIMPSPDGGRSRDLTIGCSNQKHLDALLKDPHFLPYRDPENDIVY